MNASKHVRRTTSGPNLDRHRPTVTSSSSHIPEDDIPHTPGYPDCLCSACHLSRDIFPRRQDGKIELPYPWLVNSQKSGGRPPNAAGQEELIRRSRSHVELREGASRGYRQLSGPGVPANPRPESILTLPPSIRTFKMPASDLSADLVKRERSQTPAIEQAGKHADRPRQSKKNPSQPKTKRPEPWSRFSNVMVNDSRSSSRAIGHSDPEFANPYAEISSHPALATSGAGGQSSWPDPYENIVEETFPQLFDSRIMGLGKRELNQSGTSSTISQTISISSSQDSGQLDTSSTATSTSHRRGHQPHNSASSRSVSLPGRYDQTMLPPMEHVPSSSKPRDEHSIVDPPRVIRFNSCHNPQPDTWVSRNNVDEAAQGYSEIRLSPEQTHTGILRFQDPLIPESYPSTVAGSKEPSAIQLRWDSEEEKAKKDKSPFRHSSYPSTATGSKEISVVQVKWDSERKRRQGYFAQEGEEKSPFRHYNKSNDFDEKRDTS